jgi:hypothetical protein
MMRSLKRGPHWPGHAQFTNNPVSGGGLGEFRVFVKHGYNSPVMHPLKRGQGYLAWG